MKKIKEYKEILDLIFEKKNATNIDSRFVRDILYQSKVDKETFEKAFCWFQKHNQTSEVNFTDLLKKSKIVPSLPICREIALLEGMLPFFVFKTYPELIELLFTECDIIGSRHLKTLPKKIKKFINENFERWKEEERPLQELLQLGNLPEDLLLELINHGSPFYEIKNQFSTTRKMSPKIFIAVVRRYMEDLHIISESSIPDKYLPIYWALITEKYTPVDPQIMKQFPFLLTHIDSHVRDWARINYFGATTIKIQNREFTIPLSLSEELEKLFGAYEDDFTFLEKAMKEAGFFNDLPHLGNFTPADLNN